MPNVMSNMTTTFRFANSYCPAMQYSADVNYNGGTRVNFGSPAAANATLVINGASVAAAGVIDLSGVAFVAEPFGRTVSVVLSGAGTGTVTLRGFDYLGQPISENLALNGATAVAGKKAFKSFASLTVPTVGAATLNLGTDVGLGLPYKALRVQFETANGAMVAPGTLTAPVLTDPQTATTGDPRGTYVPTTAPNGSTNITAVFDMANDVNAAGNGGLLGIKHFAN
jgi:hypothetical protein